MSGNFIIVGRKRQYEGEGSSPLTVSAGGSPSPGLSPLGSSSKRARIDSPASRVPNSVIIVERKQTYYKKARGLWGENTGVLNELIFQKFSQVWNRLFLTA